MRLSFLVDKIMCGFSVYLWNPREIGVVVVFVSGRVFLTCPCVIRMIPTRDVTSIGREREHVLMVTSNNSWCAKFVVSILRFLNKSDDEYDR